MRVVVCGLWHLGTVTAACLADAGIETVGLDSNREVVDALSCGRPPLLEAGLEELVGSGLAAGRLSFTTDPVSLATANVLWVCYDTPVDENDEADVDFVMDRLDAISPHLRPGTIVLVSSQVPVGFTRALAGRLAGRELRFAYSPENLRLGRALEAFRKPERVIVGVESEAVKRMLSTLFEPFSQKIIWMSLESAEMTKHAINAFLATSVTFINELARLCEVVGADAKEVEVGLKSEGRIGPRAYLAPGGAFAGGTLARDLRFLERFGARYGVATPLFHGVLESNESHKGWLTTTLERLLPRGAGRVALLGLTYKAGTSTLRRSAATELAEWLSARGVTVYGHDPGLIAAKGVGPDTVRLCGSAREALREGDLAILMTEWPEYLELQPADFTEIMRNPTVVDPARFLSRTLAAVPGVTYVAPGQPRSQSGDAGVNS
jgi:UDPglucose 6-dehydrogenase